MDRNLIARYMLDTNMVSYIVKGRSPAASARLLALQDDEIATISAITAAGNMDMMIAAHAIATAAVLVTNDQAFAQVEELTATVNWATDV